VKDHAIDVVSEAVEFVRRHPFDLLRELPAEGRPRVRGTHPSLRAVPEGPPSLQLFSVSASSRGDASTSHTGILAPW
jgi:hypothetical protein